MNGRTASESTVNAQFSRHMMPNIAARLISDASTGSRASLTMVETAELSAVTRRIRSPVDRRA